MQSNMATQFVSLYLDADVVAYAERCNVEPPRVFSFLHTVRFFVRVCVCVRVRVAAWMLMRCVQLMHLVLRAAPRERLGCETDGVECLIGDKDVSISISDAHMLGNGLSSAIFANPGEMAAARVCWCANVCTDL